MSLTQLSRLIVLFLAALFCTVTAASAQSSKEVHPDDQTEEMWVNDVPCKERAKIGVIANRKYRICIEFIPADLRSNPSRPNYVPISFESYIKRGDPNLSGIVMRVDHADIYPGLVLEDVRESLPNHDSGQCSITKFTAKIGIKSDARTDNYPLSLIISSGTETAKGAVEFTLPILGADKASLSVTKASDSEIDCWTGSKCSDLQLHFKNDLPYDLTISDVNITSGDLLEAKPVSKDADSLDANSEKDITFSVKAKPVTFMRAFSGFGTPKLKMRVDFKDAFGRSIPIEAVMGFQIRPNLLVLAIFLVLGAVVGTFVRIDLGRLQRAGVISRRERIVFAATTFASGILVCLIALFANIKLIVLNDQNAYSAWDPKTLFFTALIATVSGLPILYAYLKIPRPAAQGAQPPANPQGNVGNSHQPDAH
jgi:hypothetical protein